jgi:hypothetical protein
MKPYFTAGLKYFAFFILLYGVLTAISFIPQVGAAGNAMYRPPTQSILRGLFPKAYLQLGPKAGSVDDIIVNYAPKEQVEAMWRSANQPGQQKPVEVKGREYVFSYYKTFLSFYLFFVALMVLSPLPRKELLVGLLIGSILYYLFSVFRVTMALAFFFNEPAAEIYHASPFWVNVFKNINNFLTLGINLLVVLIIWIGLAFRRGNWKKLLPNG